LRRIPRSPPATRKMRLLRQAGGQKMAACSAKSCRG